MTHIAKPRSLRLLLSLSLLALVAGFGGEAAAQRHNNRSTTALPARDHNRQVRPQRRQLNKPHYRLQDYRRAANKFLSKASPKARQTFKKRSSRAGLMALGAVLTRTKVDRGLLLKVVNNPHALTQSNPRLQPTLFPALKALARLGNINGSKAVLQRAAKAFKDEGGTRGALFELVAGSAVRKMGYKLDGLSYQIGKYETDGKVDNGSGPPTLVNMKSISRQNAMPRVLAKAEDQLRKRNGTVDGRPQNKRNPALLVIGQMPGVDLGKWDWKRTAKNTGADLTVIKVDPNTGRGTELYRSGRGQHLNSR